MNDHLTVAELLTVAQAQWREKSPADQEHERRFMARDLAEYEAGR